MTEEGTIKRQICDYLSLFPHRCLFSMTPRIGRQGGRPYTSPYMPTGWPDITGLWDNVPLFIEVKTPKGKLSQEQQDFITRTQRFLCYMIVARSLLDVESVLK
jgi:hypothetical protein